MEIIEVFKSKLQDLFLPKLESKDLKDTQQVGSNFPLSARQETLQWPAKWSRFAVCTQVDHPALTLQMSSPAGEGNKTEFSRDTQEDQKRKQKSSQYTSPDKDTFEESAYSYFW